MQIAKTECSAGVCRVALSVAAICASLLMGAATASAKGPPPPTGLPQGSARTMLGQAAQTEHGAVGRILNGGSKYHCTGTLIAPDLVLTAAHCGVARRKGLRSPAHRMVFYPGYRRDSRGPSFVGQAVAIPPDYMNGGEIIDDLLLVRLSVPVPADIAEPVPVADDVMLRGRSLSVYSYGYDSPFALAEETGCRSLAAFGEAMVTSCEAVGGISGAPVIAQDESGQQRLTAVVSSRLGRTDAGGGAGRAVVVPVNAERIAGLRENLAP